MKRVDEVVWVRGAGPELEEMLGHKQHDFCRHMTVDCKRKLADLRVS